MENNYLLKKNTLIQQVYFQEFIQKPAWRFNYKNIHASVFQIAKNYNLHTQ